MKTLSLGYSLLCSSALLLVSGSGVIDAQAPQALVIQGGTLIDGNGGLPVANSVIVIQGNRIAQVGRAGQIRVPAGAQIIDARGKWVTPGLIDAKSNWNWQYGEAYLHWGVTSAMVSGATNDTGIAERDAINHGIYAGPRLFETVMGLRGPGPDGKKPDDYVPGAGNRIVHTPEEARAQSKLNLEGGADFLYTNDGDGDPAIFAAVADEAHKAGKAVIMRAVGPQTRAHEAALAGADVLVHTGEVGVELAKDPAKWKNYVGLPPDPYSDMDDAKVAGVVKFLVDHHVALEPDLMATDRGFHKNWKRVQQEDRDVFNDPAFNAYFPDYDKARLWENVRDPETYMLPDQIPIRAAGFKNHMIFLKRFVDGGGHIVAASDITQSAAGLGLHQEMAAYQEDVGMKPMQIIQSATSWVADAFKISDIGRIQPGKLADIDIVTADPTADILNMRKLDTVIKDGKVSDRAYHAVYKGNMFNNNETLANFGFVVVDDATWAAALKQATFRANAAGEGGKPGALADPEASPTPGIESIFPHTVLRGSPTQTLQIKGFNFVKKSQVYVDNKPVPTKVVSRTELQATIDQTLLAQAGKLYIVVKHPRPLADPEWGEKSNPAYLLVPFEFTTAYSHNKY